ncbi:MAG TPA: glycoside hydrolase family 28 protein [Phycisphaerae bacterium]|nr:glycoside hydrolase family 28 protein [Phycisphaerae bacterium]
MTRGAWPPQFKFDPRPSPPHAGGREAGSAFFNVLDYGITPDTSDDSTSLMQAAIDACAAAGGGTVVVPAGTYRVGTMWMRSHITLHLEAGAVLRGIRDLAAFPLWNTRWEGPAALPSHAGILSGEGLENVAITGRGKIDGNGSFWWDLNTRKQLAYFPSRLIRLVDCRNVLIEGIEINNSGAWAVVPVACENVTISRITIINPPDSPNTDGIDVDSCRNVHISDCCIDVGDDAIAIKSGKEDDFRATLRPSENIVITNCTILRGHSAVAFGSETSGGIRNVVISNCVFSGTDRGIRFKTRRGRGGVVEDVRAFNIIMDGVHCPIVVNLFYGCGAWDEPRTIDRFPYPVGASTPQVRRLYFSNISGRGAKSAAAFVLGLPEMPVSDLFFQDVSIALDPLNHLAESPAMAPHQIPFCRAGFVLQFASRVRLRDVQVCDQLGPAFCITDSQDVRISNVDLLAASESAISAADPEPQTAPLPPNTPPALIGVNSEVVESILRNTGLPQ